MDALTDPERPAATRVIYRGVFRAMNVYGIPEELRVGNVLISTVLGPILTQATEVMQRSGFPLVFDKHMAHRTEIGGGYRLTIVQIERSPVPENLSALMVECREEGQAALSLVAAVLDERVAQEQLSEDLVFLDGDRAVAAADLRQQVRSFLPYEVREKESNALLSMAELDVPRHVETAARWYLRGAQIGPLEDGVIFLWFAVETLVGSSKKIPIEDALRAAGKDPADQEHGVGRLHGLRSRIVHDKPDEQPPDPEFVREGYYDLEGMVRALLRKEIGVRSSWPMRLVGNLFESPWNSRIQEAWSDPKVEFHDQPLAAGEPTATSGLRWAEIAPPVTTATDLEVRGGQGQDSQRVRRIVESALLFFGNPDLGEFSIQIKRFDDPQMQGRSTKDCIEIASKIVDPVDNAQGVGLAELLHKLVGRSLLEHQGVPAETPAGSWLHGVLSGWVGLKFLTVNVGIPLGDFRANPLPDNPSPFAVGEQLGASAAGLMDSWEIFKSHTLETGELNEDAERAFELLGQVKSPAEFVGRLRDIFASLPE